MVQARFVALLPLLLCATSAIADSRTWTDSSGKFRRDAELVDFQNGHAYLREADGRIVPVPESRLSQADRDFLKATVPAVQVIVGKAVGITDGDTLTVLDDAKEPRKIRLEGIDAPESHQAYGTQSKRELSHWVFDKTIRVEWREKDKYGRTLGHIFLDDRWINKDMVQEGWAWHYREYSKSPVLAEAEAKARADHVGLWADDNPIPPWDFRHNVAAAPKVIPKSAPSKEPKKPAKESKQQDITVYVTKTGEKYHTDGCRYLSKSKIPMPLAAASKRYSPCSVCHPPTAANEESSSDSPTSSSLAASTLAEPTSVDRNPNNETVTGHTATGMPTYTGPRGGQYHYSKNGNKVYERKKK